VRAQSHIQSTLEKAFGAHRAGQLDQAEKLYKTVLSADKNQFEALHFLGLIEFQRGRHEQARRLIEQSLKIDRASAQGLSNYARVLNAMERFEDALKICNEALTISPGSVEALTHRGNALRGLKRFESALASYDQALAIKPDYVVALTNRGNVLNDLERRQEALACYDAALAMQPDQVEALNGRGVALNGLKRDEEALVNFDKALAIMPNYVEALINRGAMLQQHNRHEEALASYDKALQFKPDHAVALNGRGVVLRALKRDEEALDNFDKALAIMPNYLEALINRGAMLHEKKRYEEALASYDKALQAGPDSADGLLRRGNALLDLRRYEEALASYDAALRIEPDLAPAIRGRGAVFVQSGRYDDAADSFRKALDIDPDIELLLGLLVHSRMQVCDWNGLSKHVDDLVAGIEKGKRVSEPFPTLSALATPFHQFRCSQIYVAGQVQAPARPLWNGTKHRHDRIRVAYVSADLGNHPVAFLMAGLFERHDPLHFETFAISLRRHEADAMASRLQGAFHQFIDVERKSDGDVAGLLRDMEIDIAVDLMGYTRHARPDIFASRPAPIQVSYLGFPGTTGAEFIDYAIGDEIVLPFDQQAYFTEKIVHLPGCFMVNDSTKPISPQVPSRAQAGLPEHGFVFCCFNQSYKISPLTFDVWMRLLARVEGSVMWLSQFNDRAMQNLRSEAKARGIDPRRLIFAARFATQADHLARQRLADLFLDTLPYNAHSTATDALWAGVPVLTCAGTTFAGRVAASLLHAVGLPELVTSNLEQYEALAFELAMDPRRLRAIRGKLETNRLTHPLFDTDRFRRNIEAAYRTMWEIWQRGEPPRGFSIPAPSSRNELQN
jgi:protein O-GlcNAc transferase